METLDYTERPHRLGVVSRLYPQLTATFLTEALRNVFYGESKKASGFLNIDSTYFEWDIEVNYIKRVPLAAVPNGNGANGTEIEFVFGENYYQLHEIFKMENTGLQFFVVSRPVRLADNAWSVMCRLIDDDYAGFIDPNDYNVGDLTRFIGE